MRDSRRQIGSILLGALLFVLMAVLPLDDRMVPSALARPPQQGGCDDTQCEAAGGTCKSGPDGRYCSKAGGGPGEEATQQATAQAAPTAAPPTQIVATVPPALATEYWATEFPAQTTVAQTSSAATAVSGLGTSVAEFGATQTASGMSYQLECFSCHRTATCSSGGGEVCFVRFDDSPVLAPYGITCQPTQACEPTESPGERVCIPAPGSTEDFDFELCEGKEWAWDIWVKAHIPPHRVQVSPFPRWIVGMGAPMPDPFESGSPGTLTLQDYPALSNAAGVCEPGWDGEGCWSEEANNPDPPRTDPLTGEEAPQPGDIKNYRMGLRWRRIDIMPGPEDPGGAPAICWDWDEREWNVGRDYGYGPIPAMNCGKSVSHIYETSSWGKPRNGPNFIPGEDACPGWMPACDTEAGSTNPNCHCCEQIPTSMSDWRRLPGEYDFDPDLGPWQNPAYQVKVPTYWAIEWADRWEAWEVVGQDCECQCHGGEGSKECHKEGEPDSWCTGTGVHSERICEPEYGWVDHFDGWHLIDLRAYGEGTWYRTSWSVVTTGSYAGCEYEYSSGGNSVRIPVIEVQSVLRDPCHLDGTCPSD